MKGGAGAGEEGVGPLAHKSRECLIDPAAAAGVEDLDLQSHVTTACQCKHKYVERPRAIRFRAFRYDILEHKQFARVRNGATHVQQYRGRLLVRPIVNHI